MSDTRGNTLLNLNCLIENFHYSHLWRCKEILLDNKLETLELIDSYNEIRMSGNVDNYIEEEIYSLLVDLEFLNKNITTVKMAIQLKHKECVENLDTGTYFLN